MAENAKSWLQQYRSWSITTHHGRTGLYKGLVMKTVDGVVRRLPVKYEDGSIDLIEIDGIFYLKAPHSFNSQVVNWLNSLMDNDPSFTN
jgi:hypothetical protein